MAKRKARKAPGRKSTGRKAEAKKDPRLWAIPATEINGESLPPDTWVQVLSPVTMDDGRELAWYPPHPVGFSLVEAKRFRDQGVSARRKIMGNLKKRDKSNAYRPANSTTTIDCIRDLQSAVLLAFTAVESFANQAIDTLDDNFTLRHKRKDLPKKGLVWLGLDDKLKLVLPKVDGGKNVAGTAVWERYRGLKSLRNDLVHVKRNADPTERTAYDRLLLGDGDECVEDALALIEAAWPGFLLKHIADALTA